MKTRIQFLSVSAVIALMVMSASIVAAADGPKLVVPEKIKNMGRVAQGDVLSVDFELINEGDEPIEVKAVRPTCGCTVADFDREIPPGGTGYVKAKLETRDFSGPISKSILIMTNDPQDPTVTVTAMLPLCPTARLPRFQTRGLVSSSG